MSWTTSGCWTAGNLGGTVDNNQDSNRINGISVGSPGTTADAVDYLFAEIEPSDLFGTVWRDFNHDGEINFGEAGIQSVAVALSGSDDRGNPVSAAAQTDGNGAYAFIDLRPGTYAIEETQPAGFDDGKESLGTQVSEMQAYCERRAYEPLEPYVDVQSGADLRKQRPHFQRMLGDVRAGLVDVVVVWRHDRAFRDLRQS